MNVPAPSSLSPDALACRLADLVSDERGALADFLLHLEEFDRRRAWAEAGYDSLWSYCQRVLHLREGPAGRRIGAMRMVRRFPRLADTLRDGRLCLSTVTLLAPLLTEETLDDVVAKAAYRTKAEVEHLVASFLPRQAPKDGIRMLPDRQASSGQAVTDVTSVDVTATPGECAPPTKDAPLTSAAPPASSQPTSHVDGTSTPAQSPSLGPPPAPFPRPTATRPTLTPVSSVLYSLRVTVDAALKADFEELAALLSHKVPNGNVAEVLREAVLCALEKHGRRKGARPPARERAPAHEFGTGRAEAPGALGQENAETREPSGAVPAVPPRRPASRPHIPAHVRREVWRRDGGRCTWSSPDGHRCGSRWRLELDHIEPFALGRGGTPTADELRLVCRSHNHLYAEQVYGADHMARFHRDFPGRVRLLIPGSGRERAAAAPALASNRP